MTAAKTPPPPRSLPPKVPFPSINKSDIFQQPSSPAASTITTSSIFRLRNIITAALVSAVILLLINSQQISSSFFSDIFDEHQEQHVTGTVMPYSTPPQRSSKSTNSTLGR